MYAYAGSAPLQGVDPDGRLVPQLPFILLKPKAPPPSPPPAPETGQCDDSDPTGKSSSSSPPSKTDTGDTSTVIPAMMDRCSSLFRIPGGCAGPEMGGGRGGDGPDGPIRVPPKMNVPEPPRGMTRSELGQIWGRAPAETERLTQSLDARIVQQHVDNGFTKEIATQWRNFYVNEAARNPENSAAIARTQFLDRLLSIAK